VESTAASNMDVGAYFRRLKELYKPGPVTMVKKTDIRPTGILLFFWVGIPINNLALLHDKSL
jgi:hypothetical protein